MGMLPEDQGRWYCQTLKSDVVPATFQEVLAITNARRIIWGFVWYYHASGDTATRTMKAALRNVGLALPTGMTEGDKTTPWSVENIATLTANEEGEHYVIGARNGGDDIQVRVDDGTIAIGNEPIPFPLMITQEDLAELVFTIGSPHANDRHSIYLLVEEWIEE